jgi:hypothetical protein
MASELKVTIDTRGFQKMAAQFAQAGRNIKPALRRAINHTGDKARTQIARVLVKQTGLKYGKVRQALRTVPAGTALLVYRIIAKGGYTSLKEFGARQVKRGVSAAPWGKRHLFPHAFIAPSLGGHVFIRKGKGRFPIHKLWGPAIPAEMVKAESRAAFERTVATELPARLALEINAILAGRAPSG